MAKKKQTRQRVKPSLISTKDKAKATEKKMVGTIKSSKPVGKDGKPIKTIRLDTREHEMAKTVFKLADFRTMQEYLESLILADMEANFPTIYKKLSDKYPIDGE